MRDPQLAHPPSSHEAGVPSGFFLPHSFISSSFAHLMPLLRISMLFSISVSGNFPSFLKMMLKHRPNTHSPTSIRAAKITSINSNIKFRRRLLCPRRNQYQFKFLVDETCADCLVVVNLVDDVCKHLCHRKDCDLALVLRRIVAEWNSVSNDNLLKF